MKYEYIDDDPTFRLAQRVSKDATPWAIICSVHGQVFLTREEYDWQMNKANAVWICPICPELLSKNVTWDDDNYESYEIEMDPDFEETDSSYAGKDFGAQ